MWTVPKRFWKLSNSFRGWNSWISAGALVSLMKKTHRLDLKALARLFEEILDEFLADYDNQNIMFKIEPGRYIVAESSVLLGRVHSVKDNYGRRYIGTDIGFNVNMRPVMYDSYHHIDVAKEKDTDETEIVYVCGNICESGDLLAKERLIKKAEVGDVVVMKDTGAYCFSMASNYNCRLRPAEVLIGADGSDRPDTQTGDAGGFGSAFCIDASH